MAKNISKHPIKRKREEKRIAKLARAGRIVKSVEIPEGSLPANADEQNHRGGYAAKFSFTDIHYPCAGCQKNEVWTAQQQKRYFEEQRGNIYNRPKWCYECHSKRMKEKKETKAWRVVKPDAQGRRLTLTLGIRTRNGTYTRRLV